MNNRPNSNNRDNIIRKKKKKPSKAKNIVKAIFFVNYKILSYLLNVVLTIVLITIITGGICVGTFLFYVNNYVDSSIPNLALVETSSDLTSTIYYYKYEDRFDKTKGEKQPVLLETLHGSQNRQWVKYADTPENLRYAFVALEDKRFFEHKGVDWLRTASAVREYLNPESRTFGASTITQQLLKLITKDSEVTVERKIREITRALNLDSTYSKEDILENYMNTVFLAHGCYGVKTAARFYFDKEVADLTLIECAAIATIVQGPSVMNPYTGKPERYDLRRNQCLENMLEEGWITQEQFDEAYKQELILNRPVNAEEEESINNYFVDYVIEDVTTALMEEYGYTRKMASNLLFSGGLDIYTTMDSEIQSVMEYVYMRDEYFPPQPAGAAEFQSAMVILDPENGELLGIVGGRGTEKVRRGLNRASQSSRSPGSSLKPISVYAPAMDMGFFDWGTPLDDSPFKIEKGKHWPTNLPLGFEGYISPLKAISVSKNTTAVHMLDRITPEYAFKFLQHDLNMKFLVEREVTPSGKVLSDIDYSPLALGGMTHGVTTLELTAAYTILANKGIYSKPRSFTKVVDQKGNVILDNKVDQTVVLHHEETAYIMTRLLQSVVNDELQGSTGRNLPMRKKIDIAAKTGTTNNQNDRWFVGYTPYYVCGVWFGYDKQAYLNVDAMKSPPMLLFDYVMDTIHQPVYDSPKKFEQPANVVEADYCIDSGMAPGPNCKLDLRGSNRVNRGFFRKGAEPNVLEPCTVHVPVDWCNLTKRVASPNCPRDTVVKISLIREERRAFKAQISLPDVGYTYRDVPSDYVYPSHPDTPFYINTVPRGVYVGAATTSYYNGYCTYHNNNRHLAEVEAEETEEAEETTETTESADAEKTTEPANPEDNNNATEPTVAPETTTAPPEATTAIPPTTEEPTTAIAEMTQEITTIRIDDEYVQPPPQIFNEITVAAE